jgi:protein ImuB
MRLLHLYWPHLLIRLAITRSSTPFGPEPIVLGGRPWAKGPVLDASRSALELGVRPGMALGSAHRLAPEARFLDPDPAADSAALEAALERLAGFSPGVVAETDPTMPGFGRADVQLDGLARLWGPEPLIVERIGRALAEVLPGSPLAGIGGTRFVAAVAASLAGRGGGAGTRASVAARTGPAEAPAVVPLKIVPAGADTEFLAPLPASLLTRDPVVRARLDRFGLRSIGQVAELPLSAVVARFGAAGERISARARGLETEPFRPRRAPERMALALPIEPPVADIEALRFVLHRLAATFGDQLVGRGAAAGRARLTLELDGTFVAGAVPSHLTIDQRLPEPTSEGLAVERLLLARVEAAPPPAPVCRIELELGEVAPAAGTQLTLFTPQTGRTGRLAWQLARLGLRFGPDRIGWMEVGDPEAPLPETRWSWRRAIGLDEGESSAGSQSSAADTNSVGRESRIAREVSAASEDQAGSQGPATPGNPATPDSPAARSSPNARARSRT